MLSTFDATTGNLTYYCLNPACPNHGCANWESFRQCVSHDTIQQVVVPASAPLLPNGQPSPLAGPQYALLTEYTRTARVSGQPHTWAANHPEIFWSGPDIVALPMCPCGSQMFLKVNFSAAELQSPNLSVIQRDPQNPATVTGTWQHPAVALHSALATYLQGIGNTWGGNSALAAKMTQVAALAAARLGH